MYLKFDKKLILHLDELKIDRKKEVVKVAPKLEYDIDTVKYIVNLFKEIKIRKILLDAEEYTFFYDYNSIYIDSREFNISAKPYMDKKSILFNIYSIYAKKYDLYIDGKLDIDLDGDIYKYYGNYYYHDLQGKLKVDVDDEHISFLIDSNKQKNIHFVKKFVDLPQKAEEWMYDNVEGIYSLIYLKGKIDRDTLKPIIESFEGLARVKDAKVKFHPNVDRVLTKHIDVVFKDDALYFKLMEPKYKGTDLKGSKVTIFNLTTGGNTYIDINLKAQDKLDQKILDILKAYKIELPLKQTSGVVDASVNIKVVFINGKTNVDGLFKSKKGSFLLNDIDFDAKNAEVLLDGPRVYIKKANITYNDILNSNINFEIDLTNNRLFGKATDLRFHLKRDKFNIVNIDNASTDVDVKFGDITTLYFKDMNLEFILKDDDNEIRANDLSKFFEYSPLLKDLNIPKGNIYLITKNFSDFYYRALLQELQLPFRYKDKNITQLEVYGDITDDKFDLTTTDNMLTLVVDNKNVDIDIRDYDIIYKTNDNNGSRTAFDNKTVIINSRNNNIIYNEKHNIPVDNLNIILDKNATKLKLATSDSTIFYEKNELTGKFDAKLTTDFVNKMAKKDILKDVEVTIKSKYVQDKYVGSIELSKGKIKNLALLNNIITVVNTSPVIINPILGVPTLVSALKDGFSPNGYLINNGTTHFTFTDKDNKFIFTDLYINGVVTDIHGKGVVLVDQSLISADLEVTLFKDFANIVKKIPMLNYIILGDDKKVGLNVYLDGNVSDPEVKTIPFKDAASESIDMTKRILTSPIKIIKDIFSDDDNSTK